MFETVLSETVFGPSRIIGDSAREVHLQEHFGMTDKLGAGNASPAGQSEAPGRSSGAAHQQHPKPENQNSQHMLTILFEIITFLIRKPLNHVTVVAENS